MAFNKKYAGLPDLDLAPDIYETPELTDSSTLATATVRSPSPFQDESTNPEIDRQRLQPDQARSHFLPSRLDARDVDFSDSIASRRKSYKALSRRRQRREDGTEVLGDVSDEEDESLERKLARLRREAEELKEELATRKAQRDAQPSGASVDEDDSPFADYDGLDNGVLELSRALDSLHTSSRGGAAPITVEEILSQKLGGSIPPSVHATKQRNEMLHEPQSNIPAGLLSNAAAFDARLTLLEAALGIPNTPVPHSSDDSAGPQPILPTLNHLSLQLSTLFSTLTGPSASIPATQSHPHSQPTVTTPHIEALTTRIRKLTADADALSSARRRATEAARAVIAARIAASTSDDPTAATITTTNATGTAAIHTSDNIPPSLSSLSATEIDSAASEQAAKIQALYTTLPTITSLHPLLPSVLERLRSLRAIHAGAARAAEDLDALEDRQAEMKREIEQWRDGLEVVEGKVRECEVAMKGNMEIVGPWVKGLEGRLERLGA
ncbi:hypothetical protein AJ78_00366 [Emergomyces pasteurianus Ep9510]|uniref:Dynactin 2 n=1 Tax=Emergomyces pasteurianus Ep9510 TaxID=1447872 RepID=A0A1J9QHF9_9EURO|nr:hypothetical protein AJ78_00366 [Emergomyces pasteurianus Ep9510]